MYVDKEGDFSKMEGKNISVFKYQQISVERTKIIIAELHARAKRARGRSPIAKEIYPSQKIW